MNAIFLYFESQMKACICTVSQGKPTADTKEKEEAASAAAATTTASAAASTTASVFREFK